MCTRCHCGKHSLCCWLKKVFVQVALDIDKMWPLCCCFISFEKIAWLWGLAVAVFVVFGFERAKVCLWDCLWGELRGRKTPWKKTSSILYFYALTNGLLSQISSNGVILISVVLLESWQWFTQNSLNLV